MGTCSSHDNLNRQVAIHDAQIIILHQQLEKLTNTLRKELGQVELQLDELKETPLNQYQRIIIQQFDESFLKVLKIVNPEKSTES